MLLAPDEDALLRATQPLASTSSMASTAPLRPEDIRALIKVRTSPTSDAAHRRPLEPEELPPSIAASVWRGDAPDSSGVETLSSGWNALDTELPGQGWPCRSPTEIRQPQPGVCEWRLLAPSLRSVVDAGKTVVIVGPARQLSRRKVCVKRRVGKHGLPLSRPDRPDFDRRRDWHRIRATLGPPDGLVDGGELPYPVPGDQVALERSVDAC